MMLASLLPMTGGLASQPPHLRGEKHAIGAPKFDYHLDESDPDIVVLRRQDDTFVAAFSARGATDEGIVEAAREDYRELLRVLRTSPAYGSPKYA
jgi:hypothetical protein